MNNHTNIDTFEGMVEDLNNIPDPYDRIQAAWAFKDTVTNLTRQVIQETIQTLINDRWTQTQIAANLGISKQRVGQILNGN